MKIDCLKEIYLCSCRGEGVSVEKWSDQEIYLAFWACGKYGSYPLRRAERFRWIWKILTTGEVWADEVIFDNDTARKLGHYLVSITRNEK